MGGAYPSSGSVYDPGSRWKVVRDAMLDGVGRMVFYGKPLFEETSLPDPGGKPMPGNRESTLIRMGAMIEASPVLPEAVPMGHPFDFSLPL